MKDLVLELVTSYENRISAVEELIVSTYNTTTAAAGGVNGLEEERQKLKISLQKSLARNCSLRRKDFDRLMQEVLGESEGGRQEIEAERTAVVDKVKSYLDKQKEMASSLRQRLSGPVADIPGAEDLETVIVNMRASYQDATGTLFTRLRDFQLHLETYCREQQEINHKLERLVNRGESLKIEDVRRVEAGKETGARKAERALRRSEVERLLAHFKQSRQATGRRSAA